MTERILRTIEDATKYVNYVANMFTNGGGKPLEVSCKVYKGRKTVKQTNALFGVAYPPLMEHTGMTKDELHMFFCMEYFGSKGVKIGDRVHDMPVRSTTRDQHGKSDEISALDMARMFEFVQIFAARDMGVIIPDPDPAWRQRKREMEREEEKRLLQSQRT